MLIFLPHHTSCTTLSVPGFPRLLTKSVFTTTGSGSVNSVSSFSPSDASDHPSSYFHPSFGPALPCEHKYSPLSELGRLQPSVSVSDGCSRGGSSWLLQAVPVLSVSLHVVMLPTEPSPSSYIISQSTNPPPSLSCDGTTGLGRQYPRRKRLTQRRLTQQEPHGLSHCHKRATGAS